MFCRADLSVCGWGYSAHLHNHQCQPFAIERIIVRTLDTTKLVERRKHSWAPIYMINDCINIAKGPKSALFSLLSFVHFFGWGGFVFCLWLQTMTSMRRRLIVVHSVWPWQRSALQMCSICEKPERPAMCIRGMRGHVSLTVPIGMSACRRLLLLFSMIE